MKNKDFEKIYNDTVNTPFIKDLLDRLSDDERKIVLEGLEKYVDILSTKFVPGMTQVFNYDISGGNINQQDKKIIKDE